MLTSRYFLLRIKMCQAEVIQNRHARFISISLFFFGNRSIYEILWKNTARPNRPQMTIWFCVEKMQFSWDNNARIQTVTHNISQLLLPIWLIPSDLVKCFKHLQKLRNYVTSYLSLRSVQPNCTSQEGREQSNVLVSQCCLYMYHVNPVQISRNVISFKNSYVQFALLPVRNIYNKSVVVHHSVFLYWWHWHVTQQQQQQQPHTHTHTHTHRMRCCVTSALHNVT